MWKKSAFAACVVAGLIGGSVGAAGAQDSYQLDHDPDPIGESACVAFPRNHALHADISSFANTDQDIVDGWRAQLIGLGYSPTGVSWTISSDANQSDNFNVWGMPVVLSNASTTRALFRIGGGSFELINPSAWWYGAMWRMSNTAGNLPDRATIPVPNAVAALPATTPGVKFPVESAYIEGDAPHNYGDRHYLTIETDECAAYETIGTVRPAMFGNATDLVNGGYRSFAAQAGAKWDLNGVSAAYRSPTATFPAFGYGTTTPFQSPDQINGTSHHWTNNANRYRATDAAGLPLSTTVLRYEDVATGPLEHALHMAINPGLIKKESLGVEWPAIHSDGTSSDADDIPMGTWFRLELSDADMAIRLGRPLSAVESNILAGLRTHGMILADSSGGGWGFPVEPDDGWTAGNRQMVGSIDLGDFTALVDPDTAMRTTTGPIASTYATWFQID